MTTSHTSRPGTSAAPTLHLRAILGPYLDVYALAPSKPAVVGRVAACDVCLMNEAVSRRHASIAWRAGNWFIVDESSRAGTFVNGVRLAPTEHTILRQGDLLRIGPWTLRVEIAADNTANIGSRGSVYRTIDDAQAPGRRLERLTSGTGAGIAVERLRVLTECLAALHASTDERAMAHAALQHALKGASLSRGAVVVAAPSTPALSSASTPNTGEVEILASSIAHTAPALQLSRSLIAEAGKGSVVMLDDQAAGAAAIAGFASLVDHGVRRAVCAPVIAGESVEAYIYLDATDLAEHAVGTQRPELQGVGAFCEAIARAYGLALSNAKRAELERRQRELTSELQAARAVQETIAPPPQGEFGPIRYAYRSEPGVLVVGDVLDVFAADDSAVVCIGDAAGHGAGSGMLMALTQAFLHARLSRAADLPATIAALNNYLCQRITDGRFVSLLALHIAPDGTVHFVDAGHGHWCILHADGTTTTITNTRDIPLGIAPNRTFAAGTFTLTPTDRLVLYSDGIIEQQSSTGEEFGPQRMLPLAADRATPINTAVNAVLHATQTFARAGRLDDDATIALIEMRRGG